MAINFLTSCTAEIQCVLPLKAPSTPESTWSLILSVLAATSETPEFGLSDLRPLEVVDSFDDFRDLPGRPSPFVSYVQEVASS
jgi:hypothetical protein